MYFLWHHNWRTYMIIFFFLQVFIYLTLGFFLLFLKNIYVWFFSSVLCRNSMVWIRLTGIQTHLTKWRTGDAMLRGDVGRFSSSQSGLDMDLTPVRGHFKTDAAARPGCLIIVKQRRCQTLRLHSLPTHCHNLNPSTHRKPNFLNKTSIYHSKRGKYFLKRERCFNNLRQICICCLPEVCNAAGSQHHPSFHNLGLLPHTQTPTRLKQSRSVTCLQCNKNASSLPAYNLHAATPF